MLKFCKTRIVCRTIIIDGAENMLLVRNKKANFWYPPGGYWNGKESLKGCAIREVFEETNLKISLSRLLYIQHFYQDKKNNSIELFWLADVLRDNTAINHFHKDENGIVEESRWFSKKELGSVEVFPERLKKEFWREIKVLPEINDQFIV